MVLTSFHNKFLLKKKYSKVKEGGFGDHCDGILQWEREIGLHSKNSMGRLGLITYRGPGEGVSG